MTSTYEKDDRPVISTKSTSPNFQPRPFAPPQSAVSQVNQTAEGQSINVKSLLPESLLGKGLFTPRTESSGRPVQRQVLFSRRTPVQAKLNIGEPDDKYEKEADSIAPKVVQQINSSPQHNAVPTQEGKEDSLQLKRSPKISKLQRQASVEEEDEELQRSPLMQRREKIGGGEASEDLESSIQSARGGGQSLDSNLQVKMGQAMGADFSRVKVHTDARSDQLNRSIQAKAFTTGQDVFFRQGAYQPSSRSGQELIAHELTHVVQQNGGTVQRQASRVIQRLQDGNGIEITETMANAEVDLNVLKGWKLISDQTPDWEDADVVAAIDNRISALTAPVASRIVEPSAEISALTAPVASRIVKPSPEDELKVKMETSAKIPLTNFDYATAVKIGNLAFHLQVAYFKQCLVVGEDPKTVEASINTAQSSAIAYKRGLEAFANGASLDVARKLAAEFEQLVGLTKHTVRSTDIIERLKDGSLTVKRETYSDNPRVKGSVFVFYITNTQERLSPEWHVHQGPARNPIAAASFKDWADRRKTGSDVRRTTTAPENNSLLTSMKANNVWSA
jgi:hypothetical protein